MDQTNDSGGINQTYRLLALCARAEGHPVFYEQLARQINQFTAWQELPFQAELHGMASLLWHHIHKSGIVIPDEAERTLKGLYLRQRSLNRAYALALTDITSLFEMNSIRALVLKGLALAYEYYPDPALRSLSDIDLLFKQEDVLPALHLLADAGFSARFPDATLKRTPKELTADSPLRDGLRVHIELHHYDPEGRSDKDNSPDHEFEGFDSPPHTLTIENDIVYVPAPMDTLRYLSKHLARHIFDANASRPLQLKWVADIVSLVEKHTESIDWTQLRQNDPDILERLEVFYSLTPLPEHCAKIIPIKQIPPPIGVNQYPKGWPQHHFWEWKNVGFLRFLWQTFTPPSSDWWLRLHYGISEKTCRWYGQIVYRARIPVLIYWVIIHKMGLFK